MIISILTAKKNGVAPALSGIALMLCCHQALGQADEAASGYDALRIENEIKLTVPLELYDTVWAYLATRYDNRGLYLRELDPSFNCKTAEEFFIDQYYDDQRFRLLALQHGLRHRARTVLSDPSSPKNERELIQFKVNDIDAGDLSRGEYKYPVESSASQGGSTAPPALLRLIRTEYRKEAIQRLKQHQVDAARLQPSVRMEQLRKRVYLFRGIEPFATLTLDRIEAQYQGKSCHFAELELELNEIGYTESDSAARREMESINELLKADLLERFPIIAQDQTPKYNKAALALGIIPEAPLPEERSNPWRSWLYLFVAAVLVFLITLLASKRRP